LRSRSITCAVLPELTATSPPRLQGAHKQRPAAAAAAEDGQGFVHYASTAGALRLTMSLMLSSAGCAEPLRHHMPPGLVKRRGAG
jgi:hypothetical protein